MNLFKISLAVFLASVFFAQAGTNDLTALLQRGLFEEEANHNIEAAMQAYQTAIAEHDKDRKLIATAVFRLGECLRKQGKAQEAAAQYERVLREFPDQETLVKLASTALGGDRKPAVASTQPNTVYEDVDPLFNAKRDAERKLVEAGALVDRITKLTNPDDQLRFFTTIKPDEVLLSLQRILAERKRALEAKTQEFGPDHPERKKAERDVIQANDEVYNRIATLVWAAKNERDSLTSQLQDLDQRVKEGFKRIELQNRESNSKQVAQQTPPASTAVVTSEEEEEIQKIKTLIQNSPDLINTGDDVTPLQKAAVAGYVHVAEFLLNNGADVDGRAKKLNVTPLYRGAERGHKAVVELLLKYGADPNAAAPAGDLQPSTPLQAAASHGYKAVADVLLASKADPNGGNSSGNTPLYFAIKENHPEIARLLLDKGADINGTNQNGESPLHWAAQYNSLEACKFLISRKADVNAKTRTGFPPIYSVCNNPGGSAREILKLLLENGANPNIAGQPGQPSPGAFMRLSLPLAALINENCQDKHEMVNLLLDHGADSNALFTWSTPNVSRENFTPLLLAIAKDQPQVVESLLEHGADTTLKYTGRNNTLPPLAIALEWSEEKPEIVASLLKHQADINYKIQGRSLLQIAVDRSQYKVAEMLCNAGIDVNYGENVDYPAIHLAIFRANPKMVQLLIGHKANLNVLNERGEGPLTLIKRKRAEFSPGAVGPEIFDTLESMLIKAGANMNSERRLRIGIQGAGMADPFFVFYKGTNTYNQHTLFEVLADTYNYQHDKALDFPDLSKLTINRLQTNGTVTTIPVDAQSLLESGDKSKDITLEWGDIIEVPQRIHTFAERWVQFQPNIVSNLTERLIRKVQVITRGQRISVILVPDIDRFNHGNAGIPSSDPDGLVLNRFRLVNLVEDPRIQLSSSDLGHIKLTRKDSSGVSHEWTFNEDDASETTDLWLRDGDVIEIPDRPFNAPPPSRNVRRPSARARVSITEYLDQQARLSYPQPIPAVRDEPSPALPRALRPGVSPLPGQPAQAR